MSAYSNMIARLETLFYLLVSIAYPMPIGEAWRSLPSFIRLLRQKPHHQPDMSLHSAAVLSVWLTGSQPYRYNTLAGISSGGWVI
jgi:hypothetical protein